ncbi:MAG: lycopene beta-cyclase [Bacteroidia bacterium]|jgi:lycopene beta-cyclase
MTKQYDYIIIGTGCAGLSLAYHLLESSILSNKSVLLLDNQPKNNNDRTWCFWSDKPLTYQSSKEIYWSELEFKSDNKSFISHLDKMKYYHINSLNFYNEILAKVKESNHLTFKQETATDILEYGDIVEVRTNKNQYYGSCAFNSVISLLPQFQSLKRPKLWQHFFGKTLKSQKPIFKDFKVRLMDFSFPNNGTVQFGYILPFTPYEALIEYTEFSDEPRTDEEYESLLNSYIIQLGIDDFEVGYIEKGQIPMSVQEFPKSNGNQILNIGTAGGFTKPTTGYTFMNIQKDVQSIIHSLENQLPFDRKSTKPRYKFYDSLLLGIIQNEPERVKVIMTQLFKNNPMERILRFLDEESSLIDEIKLFMQLPWKPFLKQLFLK